MSEVSATHPIEIRKALRFGAEGRTMPGPVSLNIANRVSFVKRINNENSRFNKRLNSVQPIVPNAQMLKKHSNQWDNDYRKFASRYAGKSPEEHNLVMGKNKTLRK